MMRNFSSSYEFEPHGNHKLLTLNNMIKDTIRGAKTVPHSGTISVTAPSSANATAILKVLGDQLGDVHVYEVNKNNFKKEKRQELKGMTVTVMMFRSAML